MPSVGSAGEAFRTSIGPQDERVFERRFPQIEKRLTQLTIEWIRENCGSICGNLRSIAGRHR
jgi:hypothetical protein